MVWVNRDRYSQIFILRSGVGAARMLTLPLSLVTMHKRKIRDNEGDAAAIADIEGRISAAVEKMLPFEVSMAPLIGTGAQAEDEFKGRAVAWRWINGTARVYIEYPVGSGTIYTQATYASTCMKLRRRILYSGTQGWKETWLRLKCKSGEETWSVRTTLHDLFPYHLRTKNKKMDVVERWFNRREVKSAFNNGVAIPSYPLIGVPLVAPPPITVRKTCCVCLNDWAPSQPLFKSLECKHLVCSECCQHLLRTHLEPTALNNATVVIKCPTGQSQCPLVSKHIIASLAPPDKNKWLSTYAIVAHNEPLVKMALSSAQDAKGLPLSVLYRCPECKYGQILSRTSDVGIPSIVGCVMCPSVQWCTRTECTVSGHMPHQHETCPSPLHQPAVFSLNLGDKYTIRLCDLSRLQRDNLIGSINEVVRKTVGGVQCPKCHRSVTKDDKCTHMTCSTVGKDQGCGTQFCFCCGGILAANGPEYVKLLQDPDTKDKVALMSKEFTSTYGPRNCRTLDMYVSEMPLSQIKISPKDPWLYAGNEILLPKISHNDGYGEVFNADRPRPSGRCPLFLGAIDDAMGYAFYPWFLPEEDFKEMTGSNKHLPTRTAPRPNDTWYLERWTELKMLRALYDWMGQYSNPTLFQEALASPQCVASSWPYIQSWAKNGFPVPTASKRYKHIVESTDVTCKVWGLIKYKIAEQNTEDWATDQLKWQRWVLGKISPLGPLSPEIVSDTSDDPIVVDE